jgi:subfamily B ATP-binding cassette protein MsbA
VSAALSAVLSGALVWMVGPLMMTLFLGDSTAFSSMADPTQSLTGLAQVRESLNEAVNNLVLAETQHGTLVNFCIIIFFVVIIKNLFLYLQGFFMAFVQQSIIRDLRNDLFAKYQSLSLDYFHRRRTGETMSRITNDVMVLNDSIDVGFNRLIADALGVLIFASFLFILSWQLTLLSLVVMPAVFGFIWYTGRKLRKYSERSQQRMADVNSVLEESLNNMRIVKAFSMEAFELKKFFTATKEFFKSLLRMTRIRQLASPINDILATVAGVIILLYAGTQIIEGRGAMDAGDFLTFVLALFSMIKPVKSLSQVHIKLQEGVAASERIFAVIDTPVRIADTPTARAISKFADRISYDSVSFSYNGTDPILREISFNINRGEVVALVGPSGGGKSTLIDLLPRFYDPQGGQISIDGVDIRNVTLHSLRNMMGIVTQETILFNDTIRNNIAYGLNGVPHGRIEEAARMANAHDFILTQPQGYETVVGNRGVMLSGGQRQRLAIARALLKNPPILIFDEATSALDTESEKQVQEAIDHLMSGRTTLVVAHRLSTIRHADRILVIDRGCIVEYGTHEELFSKNGIYHRLYSMQFGEES